MPCSSTAAGDPDEVLTTLLPRAGIVTRRVVAINAVLAGCPPATFPVVLTAIRALAAPEMNLRGVNATTHLVAPLVLVHGEIARTAGFHAGVGRVRARQPRQRHRRARGASRAAARRRRAARLGRRRDPRAAGEVHVLRGGEPRGLAVGGLRA